MLRAEEWAARSEAERPRLKSQPTPHTLTPPTPPWPSSNASCVTYPGPSISLCVKWGRYQALLPGDESFIWDDIWNILSARPGKWNILSTGMETSDADCLSLVKTSLRGGGELCPGGSWGGGGNYWETIEGKELDRGCLSSHHICIPDSRSWWGGWQRSHCPHHCSWVSPPPKCPPGSPQNM